MITKKRLVLGAAIISSTVLLASCGKTETAKELRIVDNCDTAKDLCQFELTDAVVSRYTNILGKTIERVESKTPLNDIKGTITWNAPGSSSLADNATVQSTLGVSCQDGKCTANSNPTAYSLAVGSNTISVSGTVTVDGQTIDLATDVKPITEDTEETENSFTFKSGTLPSGATFDTLAAALNDNSDRAHATFSKQGNALKIQCAHGYEWMEDQDPAYGSQSQSPYARDTSQAEWSKSKQKFATTVIQGDNWTANGEVDGDIVRWRSGCWKK
ncbi:DUF3281 family protein [Francisella hispaniensis]|uniref:DUF3281 family protein n=1 Tax=Francisella hispaniensis TaxID=622488 RepID=UPI00398B03AC